MYHRVGLVLPVRQQALVVSSEAVLRVSKLPKGTDAENFIFNHQLVPKSEEQYPWKYLLYSIIIYQSNCVDGDIYLGIQEPLPSHRFSFKVEAVEFAANVLAKCLKGIWSSRNGKEPVVPEEYSSCTAKKLAKWYFAGVRVRAEQRQSD